MHRVMLELLENNTSASTRILFCTRTNQACANKRVTSFGCFVSCTSSCRQTSWRMMTPARLLRLPSASSTMVSSLASSSCQPLSIHITPRYPQQPRHNNNNNNPTVHRQNSLQHKRTQPKTTKKLEARPKAPPPERASWPTVTSTSAPTPT